MESRWSPTSSRTWAPVEFTSERSVFEFQLHHLTRYDTDTVSTSVCSKCFIHKMRITTFLKCSTQKKCDLKCLTSYLTHNNYKLPLIDGLLCAKRRMGSCSWVYFLGFPLFHFPLVMPTTSSTSSLLSTYLLFKRHLLNSQFFNVVINTHHHLQSFMMLLNSLREGDWSL